ncbi:MAG TPA: hypothetical protein VLV86_26145, partial [Vicinamibacterales bacterium]|nr:hypothetical protein [Vicinamibacterales bacterium]
VDDFRRIRLAARQLPPLAAPGHAWTRVERALQTEGAPRTFRRWTWFAIAAVSVIAAAGSLKLLDARRQRTQAAPVAAAEVPTAQSIEEELRQAEQHYQNAISGLEQIADAEKGSLDPQVASTLEKNLVVVDQAISESRAALKAQPSSEPAQASLLESFKSKIALLEDTVALINEMRRRPASSDASAGLKRKGI